MKAKPGVVIEACSSYEPDELYNKIKKAADLSVNSFGDLNVKGKTLLVKPNIVFDSPPEKAVCTHPAFMGAVIKLLWEMGAGRILAGDSPGLQTPGFRAKASGLGDAAEKNGAEWVDFTKEKTDIHSRGGKTIKKFTVTSAVKEADIIINLPKLKTHQLMCFTGAMKNLFGLVPSAAKSAFHVRCPGQKSFASMIVDLNEAIREMEGKEIYNFMDAISAMEGPGPAAGKPKHLGLILASSNVLAMDIAACEIIGYPAALVPVNREALNREIWLNGIQGIKDIEYPSLSPSDQAVPDFEKIPIKKTSPQLLNFILPKPARKLVESLTPGPIINSGLCKKCGDCSKICASKAIKAGEGTRDLFIDYRHCIRCFCCHEICSFNAIDIVKKPEKVKGK